MRKFAAWIRRSRKALVPLVAGGVAYAVQQGWLEVTGEPLVLAEEWFNGIVFFLTSICVYQISNTETTDENPSS